MCFRNMKKTLLVLTILSVTMQGMFSQTNQGVDSIASFRIGILHAQKAFEYVQQGDTARTMELVDSVFKYGELSHNQRLINLGLSLKSAVLTLQKRYDEVLEVESQIDSTDKVTSRMSDRIKFDVHYLNKKYDSAVVYMEKVNKADSSLSRADSSFLYRNMESISHMDARTANIVAAERAFNISALKQLQLEKEKKSLQQTIYLISFIGILVIAMLMLLYIRQKQKNRILKLAHYAEERDKEFLALQKETELRLTRKYIDGLETERERLAKELHDGVCNNLLALEMNLKTLSGKKNDFKEPLSLLTETRMSVRNVSHDLMPPVFQYATIDEMLSDYTSHIDLPGYADLCYSSTEGTDWTLVPQQVGYEIYRIVQEALNNSVKHSSASFIEVSLLYKVNFVQITVKDNGKGFDLTGKYKGIGLRTIAERAKSIGGDLTIESGKDGTKISVTINIDKDERR